MKKVFLTALCISLFLCPGCSESSYIEADSSSYESTEETIDDGDDLSQKQECYVQITGAVNSPGVYSVEPGSRLFTLVEMAGGLREDASAESINQALGVTDGQSIHIPTMGEAMEQSAAAGEDGDGRININTADVSRLMTLPGIGESKAKLIVDFRETNGSYSSIEDIMKIQGIKEGVFNKIKDQITVG